MTNHAYLGCSDEISFSNLFCFLPIIFCVLCSTDVNRILVYDSAERDLLSGRTFFVGMMRYTILHLPQSPFFEKKEIIIVPSTVFESRCLSKRRRFLIGPDHSVTRSICILRRVSRSFVQAERPVSLKNTSALPSRKFTYTSSIRMRNISSNKNFIKEGKKGMFIIFCYTLPPLRARLLHDFQFLSIFRAFLVTIVYNRCKSN